jgi:hypothetical protein
VEGDEGAAAFKGTGPWMGPGARGEGEEVEAEGSTTTAEAATLSSFFTVELVSTRLLLKWLPCSRGPRGTSISPRDLPACVTAAAERGLQACEEEGRRSRRRRRAARGAAAAAAVATAAAGFLRLDVILKKKEKEKQSTGSDFLRKFRRFL